MFHQQKIETFIITLEKGTSDPKKEEIIPDPILFTC